MQTHPFHDNGFYIVFAYSSRKKDCEILLFRALLHESFQYYLFRRQGKGRSLIGYLLKIVPSKCKAIYRFVITYVIVYANSNRSSLASKYDILMTVVPTIA